VKSFLGTSANAVKTQIWTALIAMLILKYLQMKAKFGWSLSNLPLSCASNCLFSEICGRGWTTCKKDRLWSGNRPISYQFR
jgi:hypothetical protein